MPAMPRGLRPGRHLPFRVGIRIGALPVVEIEEHRRALGRRAEQIAELPEDVWPDRVPFVLREVLLCRALAREHVEVVEPEVGHHLFELALAVGGPQDLLFGQLRQHLARLARRLHLFRRAHRLAVSARVRLRRHAGIFRRVLLDVPPRHQRRHEVLIRELTRALGQRLEWRETRRHRAVGEALGMELLIDIGREPHLPDPIHVARARPEPDAVQDMKNRLVVRPRGDRRS